MFSVSHEELKKEQSLDVVKEDRLESGKEAEQEVVQPKRSINKHRQKRLDAKKKDAERKALTRKNETPEQRARRLAKIKEYMDSRRQFENERNRKRRRDRVRRAQIKERETMKELGILEEDNHEPVKKLLKPSPMKEKNLKKPSGSAKVQKITEEGIHLNVNPRSENVVPHSSPIIDKNVIKINLEKLQKENLKREKMRLVLRAQLTAIYHNFCVSQQNLIESLQLTILGVQIPLINEEIPNFFDVLIPGFLIRKIKYTISTIERITINGTTFVSHQFYSFFKFMFDQMKSGTTIAQVIVDPRLIEVFSIRFPSENFERLWRSSMDKAVSHHFNVIHIFDPINRIVVPIYKKR